MLINVNLVQRLIFFEKQIQNLKIKHKMNVSLLFALFDKYKG